MSIITVVAYRENGTDTCRGCVMERWGSDLQMITSENPAHIVEFVSDILVNNHQEYDSYSFTYFVAGRTIDDGGQYVIDRVQYRESDDEQIDLDEQLIQRIRNQAESEAKATITAIEETKKILEREKASDAERQRKNYDLAELRRLRKLYPEIN